MLKRCKIQSTPPQSWDTVMDDSKTLTS